jgi:hypothetical protein
MKKSVAAASPDAYVEALSGWQLPTVRALRAAVRAGGSFDETIKWRNLVYFSRGPAVVIRAEEARVILTFWRGQRLGAIEPKLKPGGKFEMASLVLREGDTVKPTTVKRLAKEAAALNAKLGDPTGGAVKAPSTAPVKARSKLPR